jgi:ribonucleoside-diphosphate reductase alpha chain
LQDLLFHKGIQYNLWGLTDADLSGRWDWASFVKKLWSTVFATLLVAMPTIYFRFWEQRSFEPYTSNIYTRRVLSGEFIVVNKHLLHDLVERGLWNKTLKQVNA